MIAALRLQIFLLAIVSLLCWLAVPAVAAPPVQITFLPEATVQGETLHLRDVARITPEWRAEEWGEIALFQVPDYGSVRTYRAQTLKAYIQQQAPQEAEVAWKGAEHVRVRRDGVIIAQEDMVQVVNDFLRERLDRPEITSVSFEPGRLPQAFTVADAKWECEVVPSSSQVLSARRFTLLFRRHGLLVHKVSVSGRVRAEAEIVSARRNLDRESIVQASDLRRESRQLSRLDDPVYEASVAVGQRVVRSVRAGEVLDRSVLAAPILVQRGKPVTLEAVRGALVITASGVAQEDGGLQETIRVENRRTGKEIFGTVVSADTVRVRF